MKHFKIIIIGFIITALLCGSYIYILSKSDDIGIELKTVYGSDETLKDIAVKGEICDSNHIISFSVENGSVMKRFDYGNTDYRSYYSFTQSEMRNFDSIYQVYQYPRDILNIKASQTDKAEYYIFESNVYICAQKSEKSGKFESVQPQIVFSLDKEGITGDIRYMGKVTDKLVIILSKSGYLYADVIDPVQKKLLGEIKIDEYRLGEKYDNIGQSPYDSAESNGFFILRQTESKTKDSYYRFYVIDVNSYKVNENIYIKKLYSIRKFYTKVLYKNSIIYILYDYQQEDYRAGRNYTIPAVKVYAYKEGKKLYEGDLITDAKYDDYYDKKIYTGTTRAYYNMRME